MDRTRVTAPCNILFNTYSFLAYRLIVLSLSVIRFFYDFYFPDGSTLSEEDLGRVRAEMADIVARNLPFRREEVSLEEAR